MKILLCNEAHIGDLILSTSLLPALKKAIPDCKIGFLAGSWAKEVVEDHVFVDWVHFYDQASINRSNISKREKKQREALTKKAALKNVEEVGYDIALDLHSYYTENSASFLFLQEFLKGLPIGIAINLSFIIVFFFGNAAIFICSKIIE